MNDPVAGTACRPVRIGPIAIANDRPFVLIAGPCQIESRAHALEVAAALREMSTATGVPLIFKSSFDKANRTSLDGRARHRHRTRASGCSPRSASASGCRS